MLSLTCSLSARNEEVHKIISLRTEVANTAEEERKVSSLQAELAKVQAELDEERTKVERAWSKRECTIGSIA